MKINITDNTINEEKLKKEIDNFDKKPSYLIMNSKTAYELFKDSIYSVFFNNVLKGFNDFHCEYVDIPIALCDKLKFGEVDIM